MKKIILPLTAVFLFVVSAFVFLPVQEWKIGSGYSIKFKSKDPSGTFKVKGTIKLDESNLASSSIDLTFPVSSINTGNGMRDKKAQTSEWFNASKYPNITFSSTKITKGESGYVVTGDLTIKGIKKEKFVPMKISTSGSEKTLTGSLQVNRIYYKVGKVSKTVPSTMNIEYSIPLTK
jgi:polyisoprenoid-binding protein YceI